MKEELGVWTVYHDPSFNFRFKEVYSAFTKRTKAIATGLFARLRSGDSVESSELSCNPSSVTSNGSKNSEEAEYDMYENLSRSIVNFVRFTKEIYSLGPSHVWIHLGVRAIKVFMGTLELYSTNHLLEVLHRCITGSERRVLSIISAVGLRILAEYVRLFYRRKLYVRHFLMRDFY